MSNASVALNDRLGLDPLAELLGFRLAAAREGEIEAVTVPGPEHANAGGIVHGGFLSALADWGTGIAVFGQLPDGYFAPHASLTMQYLKVAWPERELRCVARCLTAGRQAASAEAELWQGETLVGRVLSSHTVVERRDR